VTRRVDTRVSTNQDILLDKVGFIGPSYTLSNRVRRCVWTLVWYLACRWTPAPLHSWRCAILRACGANVSRKAYVYSSVRVWAPWNLTMDDYATLGPRVTCYNPAPIRIGFKAVVSQGTHLCAASHDYKDPDFQLFARPISIDPHAWVAAECFVGPGASIGEGAVLGARTVLFHDVPPWTVWTGNPAVKRSVRTKLNPELVPPGV
jgi:putative colanic acid biosynthesis acetyltransferase WcaF